MMMKQPELGLKLSELRKAKGLTQEELVIRCNVSVRTIQRIEAGEVSPRSYTVRTMLAAMGYPFELVLDTQDEPPQTVDPETGASEPYDRSGDSFVGQGQPEALGKSSHQGKSQSMLTLACLGGVAFLIAGSFEGVSDYYRFTQHGFLFGERGYIIIKLFSLVTYTLFMLGFAHMGSIYRLPFLRMTALFSLGVSAIIIAYDVISMNDGDTERLFVMIASATAVGAMGVLFGIALRTLKTGFGELANIAGILEIVAGVCLITIILALPGLILLWPAELLEILILYRAVQQGLPYHTASR